MGPIWGPPGSCWPQMGPMLVGPINLVIRNLLCNNWWKLSLSNNTAIVMERFVFPRTMNHLTGQITMVTTYDICVHSTIGVTMRLICNEWDGCISYWISRGIAESPWWHHDLEMLSSLLALCGGNPPVTSGSPHRGASIVELWCFLCC